MLIRALGSATLELEIPIVKYTSPLAKRYAELLSIAQDLRSTDAICKRHLELIDTPNADSVVIDALSTASLIRYARCFTTGKRASLDSKVVSHLPGDPIGAHDFYKNQRDKLVAHSVNPFEESLIGLALSSPEGEQKCVIGVVEFSVRRFSDARQGIAQLGALAREFLKHVEAEIESCKEQLLIEARSMPIEELYRLEPLDFTAPGPESAGKSRK